ncbi:hypothetical protein [Pseudomonas phage vB_PaeM_PAO1_Ab17]|uniref:Uncharacterized protein n=6 Tax=Nankokuvirus TaxID=1925779 RepID=A0A218L3U5_9CAUD|nr:hypothetical protein X832_gp140 [Pseudomonas phage PAK_P5]YP_008858165.1 hypothetical protein X837_gp142 [Pseudomonas phage CHA_P1]YP_009124429.1 hypothetical protein VC54_gp033 [Pseudomonas phage vB_PaeM_PAO1_Ab03]YP_009604655.1 hypothetical protein FDH93_gp028 [Pseudomonas phage vB_PaeM_G1]CEF89522.1 hypothetical protein [Pseudomonas phage vB_PaeM_PAO1_Ab17]CEQ38310.1 hypothetical protein [Pseudomonas phage vB_PaeM_PAO1_Ab04]AGR89096.1 hypothetical protein CHA_P10142c [Pseudomonas phage 
MKNQTITVNLKNYADNENEGYDVICRREFTGDKEYIEECLFSFLKEHSGQYDDWSLQGAPSTIHIRTELVLAMADKGV